MLPFCGYNIGDYLRHWLHMGKKLKKPPRIFLVNWFRKDGNGKFIWPGFGENLRVLEWIVERAEGKADAEKTPIGYIPQRGTLNLNGAGISEDAVLSQLLNVDRKEWTEEAQSLKEWFAKIGDTLPPELEQERQSLLTRLG